MELSRWNYERRSGAVVVAGWRAGSMGNRQDLRLIRDAYGRWLVRHEIRGGVGSAETFDDREAADAEVDDIKAGSGMFWARIGSRLLTRS